MEEPSESDYRRSRLATFGWYGWLARLQNVRRCDRRCRGVCGRRLRPTLLRLLRRGGPFPRLPSGKRTSYRCHLTGLISCGCAGPSPLGTGPRSKHLEERGTPAEPLHPPLLCVHMLGPHGWQSLKDTPSPRLVSSRLTLLGAGVQCRRGHVALRTNRFSLCRV